MSHMPAELHYRSLDEAHRSLHLLLGARFISAVLHTRNSIDLSIPHPFPLIFSFLIHSYVTATGPGFHPKTNSALAIHQRTENGVCWINLHIAMVRERDLSCSVKSP